MIYARIVSIESDGVSDTISLELNGGVGAATSVPSVSATAETVNTAAKQAASAAGSVSIDQVILLGAAS